MADAATAGFGIERADSDFLDPATAAVIPLDNGGAVVDFDGDKPPPVTVDAFDGDLTPLFTKQALDRLGGELVQLVDEDERSRADWRKAYARGLTLLGLNYEERTEPWEGACGAFHPMLLESVIRFNAQAMMDLFPGAGPVKTQIVGRITDEKDRQADRVRTDMNWLTAEKIKGYRDETDMMTFNLPMAGTTFRKFRFDKRRGYPAAEYVLPEHVVMPYSAASLESADRYSIILPKTKNQIEALMAEGFYRDTPIGAAAIVTTDIAEKKDKIEGKSNTNTNEDAVHRLYESHVNWWFEEDPLNPTSQPVPYVVTVDKDSHKVLAIRRNWREGDAAMERQVDVVQHKYMPGFGPYGIGLINILGGLTESATSILRQLVDAGVLSNLPAGYKTKQARVKDDSTPIGPGEWRDVEVGAATLKDSFFPLPYKEPSQVLLALLGVVVDEGRRIGSVADMKITDMTGQNMPVGTTMAIIERSMKVMTAVQKRLYESFKNEFKVIAEIVHDFMGDKPYEFELDQRDQQATRVIDYDPKKVDVIPVADPNATTMAQRIMTSQTILQLYQAMPTAGWDAGALARDFITVLGSDRAERYLPPPDEVQPRDPVTENMDLLNNRPVKAGLAQDHKAHITVHMAAAQDPKIVQLLTNNPSAPAIMGAANAHILEHLAFEYREEIEAQLGVQLPPPGEPLPEDVEYELSRLAAAAATKVLEKNTAEAKQKEILDQLQDPVIQNETMAQETKRMDAETKRIKVLADIDDDQAAHIKDVLITIFKEMSETERSTLAAEVNAKTQADDVQLRQAEIASDLGQGMMGRVADLLMARLKTDADKAKAKLKGRMN